MGMHARPQPPLTEAQRQLAADHLPLARFFARRYCSADDRRYADVEGACVDALLYATRKYDPERGIKFSSYARYWIRRAIQLYHLRTTRLPLSCFAELSEDGRSHEPLALRYRPCRSPDPLRQAIIHDLLDCCRRAVTPRQWLILVLRHVHGESLGEIGARLGISGQRVDYVEAQALAVLRRQMASHKEG